MSRNFLPVGEGSPRTLARQKKRLGLVKERIIYPINEEFFYIWSDELAWILGLIWTDGCLNKTVVSICSKDLEMLELVNFLTSNTRPIHKRKTQNAYDWISANKNITNRLRDLGLTEAKTFSTNIPPIPIEFMPGFIRGCLDGDGSIQLSKTKGILNGRIFSTICGNSLMYEGIKQYYNYSKIEYKIYFSGKNKNFWNIKIQKQESVFRFFNLIYHKKNVPCLKRKRDIFYKWLDLYPTYKIYHSYLISRN